MALRDLPDGSTAGTVSVGSAVLTQSDVTLLASLLNSSIWVPTTVNVGAGGQFASLPAALTWIKTKTVLAPVTIQVYDGTYTWPVIDLSGLPSPNMITIQGNVNTPTQCTIRTTDPSNAVFLDGLRSNEAQSAVAGFASSSGVVKFQGFQLQPAVSGTATAIYLQSKASMYAASASLVISPLPPAQGSVRFGQGAFVDQGSSFSSTYMFVQVTNIGFSIYRHSEAFISYATIIGGQLSSGNAVSVSGFSYAHMNQAYVDNFFEGKSLFRVSSLPSNSRFCFWQGGAALQAVSSKAACKAIRGRTRLQSASAAAATLGRCVAWSTTAGILEPDVAGVD